MMQARVAWIATTLLVGCGTPACPKTPPTDKACPPSDAGVMMTNVDEEATKALAERLTKLRKGGRRTVTYKPPRDGEERAYAAWVRDALVAATERGTPPEKGPEGFTLRVLGDVWLLEETRKKKRGAGVVVIRTGLARPILIEAPHTFFDAGTLPIAIDVFDAQNARVLMVNTVHRYIDRPKDQDAGAKDAGAKDEKAADEDEDKAAEEDTAGDDEDTGLDRDETDDADAGAPVVASDVAHADHSLFHAAHRELVTLVSGAVTVQIHGFRDDKADADVIVSASKSNGDAAGLAARLSTGLPDGKVSVYPTDVQILGGTLNMQARASRDLGSPFFHIEISRSTRDKLGSDKTARARFAAALDPISSAPPRSP